MLLSPPKTRAIPYRIHLLPLLIRRGWKQLLFGNVCTYVQGVLHYVVNVLILWYGRRRFLHLCIRNIGLYTQFT
jgi:hypothetical protein